MIHQSLEFVRALGRGTMGEVAELRDPFSGTRFVVKRMRPQLQGLIDLARFRREAEAMRSFNHPNIMPVLHVEAEKPPYYYVMPYREGQTLASRLAEGAIPVAVATRVMRDVCAGLVEAHRHGIVHRDVKPANIFIERSGRGVVFDFGLARKVDSVEGLTAKGAILGTPAYMAPEQCRGERADAQADVYSLGVTLVECLLGKNPFEASEVMETLRRQLEETPRRLDALLPNRVHPELGELVQRMLAKDPSHRPRAERCLETLSYIARRADTKARATTAPRPRPALASAPGKGL